MKLAWSQCLASGCVLAISMARADPPLDERDADDPAIYLGAQSADTSPSQRVTGGAAEEVFSLDYLRVIWADTKETATAPLHWDQDQWRNAGLIGGGLLATGLLLDKPIRTAAQHGRSHGSDRFFSDIQRFGTKQYGLPLLFGFYAYGEFAHDDNAREVMLDGFSASVISATLTSAIKGVVGRARPNTGHGPGYFRPFKSDYSFPSGHATGAFAFASVISSHYDSPWVDAAAYGIAGLVGVSRVRLDAHWTSDVIAGGLIGGLIGHHLVNFNRTLREEHGAFAPTIGSDGNTLTLTWKF